MLNPALVMRIEAEQNELAALLTSVLAPKNLAAHLEGDEDQPLHGLPVSDILKALDRAGWRIGQEGAALSIVVTQDALMDDPDGGDGLVRLALAVLDAAIGSHRASGYAHAFHLALDGFEHVAYAHYREVDGELANDDFSQDEDELRSMDEAQAVEARLQMSEGLLWSVDEDAPIVNAF